MESVLSYCLLSSPVVALRTVVDFGYKVALTIYSTQVSYLSLGVGSARAVGTSKRQQPFLSSRLD